MGLAGTLKVNCFAWLFLKDRLVVRGRLYRLGLVQEERVDCPISGDAREESEHLFVHCRKINMLWVRVAKLWDLNFVGTGDVASSFDI